MIERLVKNMTKKLPTNAVKNAVEKTVAQPAVATETAEKGKKQFTTEKYLSEYLAEQKAGGTWESLCQRTGFTLSNVRQCITMLRSEYRTAMKDKAAANADFLKSLAKAKKDVEVWADEKAAEKFPFLNASGTRNTEKAKMRRSWEQEELSL
jgi:hypothetical protein